MSSSNLKSIIDYKLSFEGEESRRGFSDFVNSLNFEKMLSEKDLFFWNENNYNNTEKFSPPAWLSKERKKLFDFIGENNGNLNIYAPTSFGKTFSIIQHVLVSNGKCLIISPTLSLCNEYFMNMKYRQEKYIKTLSSNKIISGTPTTDAHIYILTPEKTLQLLELKPKIKFNIFCFWWVLRCICWRKIPYIWKMF